MKTKFDHIVLKFNDPNWEVYTHIPDCDDLCSSGYVDDDGEDQGWVYYGTNKSWLSAAELLDIAAFLKQLQEGE